MLSAGFTRWTQPARCNLETARALCLKGSRYNWSGSRKLVIHAMPATSAGCRSLALVLSDSGGMEARARLYINP